MRFPLRGRDSEFSVQNTSDFGRIETKIELIPQIKPWLNRRTTKKERRKKQSVVGVTA